MQKIILSIIGIFVLGLIAWWALGLVSSQSRTQVDNTTELKSNESTLADEKIKEELEEEADAAAETSAQTIPELNPIERANPFSGSYKNPFAK
jgi:hypothetical protein